MSFGDFTNNLKEALVTDLPGTDVQWEMASSDRKIEDFPRKRNPDSKLAAVLILLYPKDNKIHTLFMQRPVYKGVHSGQISFPGGKEEVSDPNLSHTALREACEETGLCKEEVSILGNLTPLYIPVSDIEVTPVVAFTNTCPEFTPSKDEVVTLIEAELLDFLDISIIKEQPMEVRGEHLNVKYYYYNGFVIWGATAMILHELLVIIERRGLSGKIS